MHRIEVENLTSYYNDEPVLEGVSYHVDPRKFVILAGENGTAKSTLIRSTLGLLKPASSKTTVAKKNSAGEEVNIGYIPQQVASSDAGLPSTVIELVRSGRFLGNRRFKPLMKKDHLHMGKALKSVDIWEMRHERIGELSGGQRQRISLVRAFATDPDLFILDKPTIGMDEQLRNEFYQLLQHNAHEHGKAILVTTHDHGDIKTYTDR